MSLHLHPPIPAALEPQLLLLPLMGVSVSAGFPSPAEDWAEERVDLNLRYVQHVEPNGLRSWLEAEPRVRDARALARPVACCDQLQDIVERDDLAVLRVDVAQRLLVCGIVPVTDGLSRNGEPVAVLQHVDRRRPDATRGRGARDDDRVAAVCREQAM